MTMTTLRQAANDAVECVNRPASQMVCRACWDGLRAALAEPEPEPVAWCCVDDHAAWPPLGRSREEAPLVFCCDKVRLVYAASPATVPLAVAQEMAARLHDWNLWARNNLIASDESAHEIRKETGAVLRAFEEARHG